MNDGPLPQWNPGDGTLWVYDEDIDFWTGWTPGEDGTWVGTDTEFKEYYPHYPSNFGTMCCHLCPWESPKYDLAAPDHPAISNQIAAHFATKHPEILMAATHDMRYPNRQN